MVKTYTFLEKVCYTCFVLKAKETTDCKIRWSFYMKIKKFLEKLKIFHLLPKFLIFKCPYISEWQQIN